MPTPFPGMDPYLERPDLWPNVHSRLIVAIADHLAPRLRPRYYVAVEERTTRPGPDDLFFSIRPDVAVVGPLRLAEPTGLLYRATSGGSVIVDLPLPDEIRETYLEIRAMPSDQVVTVLEILSPTNKRSGEGRRQYEEKRLILLGTLTHLVEIDLLRGGQPMSMRGHPPGADYRILISRARQRPRAELLAFSVREPIPPFTLPLLPGDDEPLVELNHLLHEVYDRAGFDLRIDYSGAPDPPLVGEDRAWAESLLAGVGLSSRQTSSLFFFRPVGEGFLPGTQFHPASGGGAISQNRA